MNFQNTKFNGCYLIEPSLFPDERGYFFELFQKERIKDLGITTDDFVQDNFSYSCKNVLRGMHYQRNNPQGKLVTVLSGKVLDVIIDLRSEEPTFKEWQMFELDSEKHKQLWVPKGFAHGFLTLSENACFHYKCTDFYDPSDEYTIRWDDKEFKIDWPKGIEFIISNKDREAVNFSEEIL